MATTSARTSSIRARWRRRSRGRCAGCAGIAVSLERRRQPDFGPAAAFLRRLAEAVLAAAAGTGLPPGKVLNVNVPSGDVKAFEVTFLGRRVYRDLVDVRHDLRGRAYYWIGGPEAEAEDVPGSDMSAVKAGRASVTPLMLDLTDRALLDRVRGLAVDGLRPPRGAGQAVLKPRRASRGSRWTTASVRVDRVSCRRRFARLLLASAVAAGCAHGSPLHQPPPRAASTSSGRARAWPTSPAAQSVPLEDLAEINGLPADAPLAGGAGGVRAAAAGGGAGVLAGHPAARRAGRRAIAR